MTDTQVALPVRHLTEVVEGIRRPDRMDQLRSLLGSDAAVERFITVTIHFLSGNSDLLARCTPQSVLEAVREAATLDLEPTGVLGEAWIVRHGDRAVLRVGYRGYLKLIRRTQELRALDCQLVYENDVFDMELGTNAHVTHRPTLEARGGYRGAYAWARLNSGELIVEWMTVADIDEVRKVSQARNAGPWKDWWGEMARKTVIRRLAKRLPLSGIAEKAVATDEAADNLEDTPVKDVQVRSARARTLELIAGAQAEAGLSADEAVQLGEALAATQGSGDDGDAVEGPQEG